MAAVKTILMVSANPKEITQLLRLGEESSKLRQALERSLCRDRFKLEQCWAVTTMGLRQALLDVRPHILHFSGHGVGGEAAAETEGLVLEDEQELAKIVGGEAIAELLSLVSENLECVVLNKNSNTTYAKELTLG